MKSTGKSSEPARVLLVDDNDAILSRARAILAPTCVVIGTATDGTSALQAAEVLVPDVIVLDISLGDISGFEVASKLRQSGSAAALIFLTLHQEEDFIAKARDVGAVGYVMKLHMVSDLLHAVTEAHAGREFVSPNR